MTYLELENEVKALKQLLTEALPEINNVELVRRIEEKLTSPTKQVITQGLSRLDGEECGDCKHSSTFHAQLKGICTKVDCPCFKFVPTGKPNTQAR